MLQNLKVKRTAVLMLMVLLLMLPSLILAEQVPVGTWKTAQTIQPFFFQRFLPQELQAQIFSFTNPADQKTALLAGSLVMTGTTLAHAIHSASIGQPIVVVAALCNKCSALVVRKNGPIHSEKDLKGKTIGYVPGTMHEILLRETLARNGISPETDVKLVRVDFFDMGTALAKGNIDAFLSGEPFPTLAVEKGYGEILSYPYYEDSIGTINAGMIVKRSTIEKQPKLVARLVRAHARATEYLETHEQEWLQTAAGFGTEFDVLKAAAPNIKLAWNMDISYINQARALGERMQALGIIQRQPDYEKLFDISFVQQAGQELP